MYEVKALVVPSPPRARGSSRPQRGSDCGFASGLQQDGDGRAARYVGEEPRGEGRPKRADVKTDGSLT
jgi:hypothetical protein